MIAGDDDDAHPAVTPHQGAPQPRYKTSIPKRKGELIKVICDHRFLLLGDYYSHGGVLAK